MVGLHLEEYLTGKLIFINVIILFLNNIFYQLFLLILF